MKNDPRYVRMTFTHYMARALLASAYMRDKVISDYPWSRLMKITNYDPRENPDKKRWIISNGQVTIYVATKDIPAFITIIDGARSTWRMLVSPVNTTDALRARSYKLQKMLRPKHRAPYTAIYRNHALPYQNKIPLIRWGKYWPKNSLQGFSVRRCKIIGPGNVRVQLIEIQVGSGKKFWAREKDLAEITNPMIALAMAAG